MQQRRLISVLTMMLLVPLSVKAMMITTNILSRIDFKYQTTRDIVCAVAQDDSDHGNDGSGDDDDDNVETCFKPGG